MKKLLTITMALCSVLVAMACSSNDPEENCTTGGFEQNGEGAAQGKMLVIYFSRAGENWEVGNVERGNTAVMVDYIQEYADVDVFEIVPEVAYPSNDDYQHCSGSQQVSLSSHPTLALAMRHHRHPRLLQCRPHRRGLRHFRLRTDSRRDAAHQRPGV